MLTIKMSQVVRIVVSRGNIVDGIRSYLGHKLMWAAYEAQAEDRIRLLKKQASSPSDPA